MTTKISLDDLELKARSALDCSPWRVYRCSDAGGLDACGIKAEPFVSESEDAYQRGIVHDTNRDECRHHMSLLHAEHIVANEPRVTLALIARIRELEAGYRQLVHTRPRSAIDLAELHVLLDKGATRS